MRIIIYDGNPDYHKISNAILKNHIHIMPGSEAGLNAAPVAVVHATDYDRNRILWGGIKRFEKLFFYSLDNSKARAFASDNPDLADCVTFIDYEQLPKGLRDAVLITDSNSLFENHLSSALDLLSAMYVAYLELEIGTPSKSQECLLELDGIYNHRTNSGILLGALLERILCKSGCQSPLPCTASEFVSKLAAFRDSLLSWAVK